MASKKVPGSSTFFVCKLVGASVVCQGGRGALSSLFCPLSFVCLILLTEARMYLSFNFSESLLKRQLGLGNVVFNLRLSGRHLVLLSKCQK